MQGLSRAALSCVILSCVIPHRFCCRGSGVHLTRRARFGGAAPLEPKCEKTGVRNHFLHKFGPKHSTPQEEPQVRRCTKRRALFWAPAVSRTCGKICANMNFSQTLFSHFGSIDSSVQHRIKSHDAASRWLRSSVQHRVDFIVHFVRIFGSVRGWTAFGVSV